MVNVLLAQVDHKVVHVIQISVVHFATFTQLVCYFSSSYFSVYFKLLILFKKQLQEVLVIQIHVLIMVLAIRSARVTVQ
jgi:hypothetical protein